jgi:cell pole-organizing protein PopZ
MSASPSNPNSPAQGPQLDEQAGAGVQDPSMEDILASIRRILSEDEADRAPGHRPGEHGAGHGDDVLPLDPSMLVSEGPATQPADKPGEEPQSAHGPVAEPRAVPVPSASPLVAPEAAAAAATSVGTLLRHLIAEREQVVVHRGGPTIEDLVREEIRPLLKQWLDTNLPPMVERLVRAEIERVVGRAVS